MDYFAGRAAEQERFRDMLALLGARDITGPDEGFVVLVHGHGGIGKTTLLERYREIAVGEASADRSNRDRFVVAAVDWEHERHLKQADFAAVAGPPIWKVLDRLYRAVSDDAVLWPRARRAAQRAFGPFREQMTRLPELMDRARQLGLDGVLGRQRLTAVELGQIVDAVARAGAGLAGHPGAAAEVSGAAPGFGVIAASAADKARVYWRGAVDPDVFASLTSGVDALVRAFAAGLRSFSRKVRPVVLTLDTCELLGSASDWVLEAIRLAGARTAWVLGVRLAPQGEAPAEGALARLHTAADRDRMISLPLTVFDDRTIADYLREGSGRPLPEGAVASVVRVTRGIPLAVSFVAASLQQGRLSPEELSGSSPAEPSSHVVRGLVQRYLTHIRSAPELATDLPLVYGLALLADDRVDPRLLAALWDVPATEVSDRLEQLARRHDFVLGSSRRLHKDVGDAIRAYLLDPAERETVRPMNERAVAHLRLRLAEGYPKDLESQLSDESWQHDVIGLLWHTCWLDPREGYRALCHLFPAAAVLEPAFAVDLTQAACYFTGHYPAADQKVLDGLFLLAARPYLSAPLTSGDVTTADSPAAAMRALSAASMAEPILGAGAAPQVFVDMLATMHGDLTGISMDERLNCLERVVDRVPAGPGTTPQAVAELARRMAGWTSRVYAEKESHGEDEACLRAPRIAVALNPDDALSRSVLGMMLTRIGSLEEAEKELRAANRIDPAKGTLLGTVLRAMGRYDESVAALREAARHRPHDAFLQKDLGISLLSAGNTGEAVAELRKAARFAPADAAAHYLLGQALAQLGRFSSAEASLRRSLDIERDATVLTLLGAVVGSLGRLTEAEDICREAVGLDPDNAQAHLHLGTALGMTGRHPDAEAEFRRAIDLDPRIPETHYNLGGALTAQSRSSEAKAAFREADRLETARKTHRSRSPNRGNTPSGADSMTSTACRGTPQQGPEPGNRIDELIAEGNPGKIADELYEQLRIYPDSPEIHAVLGGVLTMLGRFQEAEGILREALDLDPADAGSHAHLGRSLFEFRRFGEAADSIRRAVQLAPEDPGVLGVAGAVLGELGNDQESVTIMRKAIRLSPEMVDLHVSLAFGLRQLGHFQEAEGALREALRLNDRDVGAHTNLGEVCLFAGKHDAARLSLLPAIELAPDSTMKAHVLLGVLQRVHDPHAARATFQGALRATDPHQSAFAASEMRAIALTALGNAETASQLLQAAQSQRNPSDTFRKPIYDLLNEPPLAGAESLLAIWQQIITDDAAAARPFEPPRMS